MLRANITGAADSGTKMLPAGARDPKPDWRCSEGHENHGRWTRCLTPGCNERRDRALA
jgi:hypothetical protein